MQSRRLSAPGTLVLVALCATSTAHAGDLVDLIPGIFPDGIRIPATGHEAHFTTASSAVINQLNDQIAGSIKPFPVAPSVGGVTYKFDAAQGTYEQTTSFLGPLVSERAQTLGQGKFSFGISFTAFEYDEFNGDDLSNLTVIARHQTNIIPPPDQFNGFEHDVIDINFDIDLEIQSLALTGTYGVTDRLDLGLIVPIGPGRYGCLGRRRTACFAAEPAPNTRCTRQFPGRDARR